MKCIGIVTNDVKDPHGFYTNRVLSLCAKNNISAVTLTRRKRGNSAYAVLPGEIPAEAEAVLVLGGDGTLLRVAGDLKETRLPLLGVNLGHLGYLTEVEAPGIAEAVEKLAANRFSVEERMLLRCVPLSLEEADKKPHVAMNDIILSRVGQVRLITIDLYVNGRFLHRYEADGLIVSTPTGSTAYNLSAGGPIIEPTTSMMVVTPICSHQLGIRSIVLSGEDILEIAVAEGASSDNTDRVGVTLDGDVLCTLQEQERIRIERAEETVRLIRFREMSFLETLHLKMK